ncbi:restriction endonuclease subunit S [Acinetobacter johnsonii]|uniref:restriction endonuclease subunit S n=1 Tax=Acinetobacter johnsonii TaxID=40214 RepID=UPI003D168846
MIGWSRVAVEELCTEITDCVNKTAPSVDYVTEYKMIRTTNIKQGRINLDEVRYVKEETYKTWIRRGAPQLEDIILTREAPVGEVGMIRTSEKVFLGQRTMMYRADKRKVNPYFLYYAFQSPDVKDQINQAGLGSVEEHIRISDAKKFLINCPSLPEQNSIASILSVLDAKIDLLNCQNKTIEKLAEVLLIEHVLPREGETNDTLHLLKEYLESSSVTHKFQKPQVIFLNTSDIYRGKVLTNELSDVKGLPGQAKKSIKKGDILFSEIRPANGRYVLIDFEAENYVVSTKLMVLRAKQPKLTGLLYFYLINKQVTNWLQVLAESRSGTFPQITFDQIADLELRLPQGNDLDNLIELLDDILLKQSANNKQIQTLENLRDTLLPKLMSGEVRVQYQIEEVA